LLLVLATFPLIVVKDLLFLDPSRNFLVCWINSRDSVFTQTSIVSLILNRISPIFEVLTEKFK
jgi:hypothetical protein